MALPGFWRVGTAALFWALVGNIRQTGGRH